MTDDEKAHTRNWMCALNSDKDVSITCDGKRIRIDYPINTSRVLGDNGLCRCQAPNTIGVRSDLTRLTGKARQPLEKRE